MKKNNKDRITWLMVQMDLLMNSQMNSILHHAEFQALESGWRSLYFLVDQSDRKKQLCFKLLDLSFQELQKDLLLAIDFDQSQLFKKVYEEEFDHPGGQPYGLLLGNYEFNPHPKDIETLRALMKISALAFAPFIAGISPAMFGINTFAELKSTLNFENLYKLAEYQHWQQLCKEEEARYIGLTLPRFLIRQPYNHYGNKIKNRFFQETLEHREEYLWTNAAFAYAKIITRTFLQSGWLANIRGISAEKNNNGAISELPREYFSLNHRYQIPKISTDIYLTDNQERTLSTLGFIPLNDIQTIKSNVFYTSQSIQYAKSHSKTIADQNAHLSHMLHYILCASRFAHYIKVIVRDKIGKLINAEQCEHYLQQWILKYCAASQHISPENRARYPLNEAKISIQSHPVEPGKYTCIIHLKPHYQLDEIQTHLRLVTELKTT